MSEPDYGLMIAVSYPDAVWSMQGNDYDTLTWSLKQKRPTRGELAELWVRHQRDKLAAEQALNDARQTALAKLAELGLTKDEISTLIPQYPF